MNIYGLSNENIKRLKKTRELGIKSGIKLKKFRCKMAAEKERALRLLKSIDPEHNPEPHPHTVSPIPGRVESADPGASSKPGESEPLG